MFGSYFHPSGAECIRCCMACLIGFDAYLGSSESRQFMVQLCDTHYAKLVEFVRRVQVAR